MNFSILSENRSKKAYEQRFPGIIGAVCFTSDNLYFETVEVRTNNNVEGDNLKMKCYCGAANLNMDKAVKVIKNF